jgi:hypothetical protein
MLLVGLGFMVFIAFTAATRNRISGLEKEEEYVLLKDIAYSVQNEINIAARMQNGYYREFNIPEELENGRNYTLNITSNHIFATSENHDYLIEIPPVIGNFVKNTNKINKTNDTLYLN